MWNYQKQERRFIRLPKKTNGSNDKIMISLNEIISIEPISEDCSKITLFNGKEIKVFEKVEKIFDYLMEHL